MQITPDNVYERLSKLGEEWAAANEQAELLEELRKTVIAQLGTEIDGSQAAKEQYALRNDKYDKHIRGMVAARKDANVKRVRYDSARVSVDVWRTRAASERVALKEAP